MNNAKVIVVTGASSGFGALTARALARAGHIVYAGIRDTATRNAPQVAAAAQDARDPDSAQESRIDSALYVTARLAGASGGAASDTDATAPAALIR